MTDIGRAYVELAHAIERHNPGYIDGYYGPGEWRTSATRPLRDLARDAAGIAAAVAALDDPQRRPFLEAQVRAMQTTIALLEGAPIDYTDEVRRLYDVEPVMVAEREFEEAIATLDELLPGTGDIAAREEAFRARFEVPVERLESLVDHIVQEFARRTRERFELPAGESFQVQLVRGKPWNAYNWYLGNYRSRIEIDVDVPITVSALPGLVAHEAYPGHHTEHAIKEWHLYREKGWAEHSILLINAPECVVSEGIAMHARSAIMSDAELRDWLRDDLVARAGLGAVDVDTMLAVQAVKEKLRGAVGNAALLFYRHGAGEEKVLAYLRKYRLARSEEARKSLAFITHANFRSYPFTYTEGRRLLDGLLGRGRAHEWFGRLLREPATPGLIRHWLSGEVG